MKPTRKLILNTALLTAASFIMQTVTVSYNVYLTNRIGAAGIGLFQLTLTVYAMAMTFACAGVRLGATRLNIDLLAKDPAASARQAASARRRAEEDAGTTGRRWRLFWTGFRARRRTS